MTRILPVALLLAASNIAVAAGGNPFRQGWYVAPQGSYVFADNARRTDDGAGFNLAFGHRGEIAAIELAALYTTLDPEAGGPEATLWGGSLGLVAGPVASSALLSKLYGAIAFGVFRREDHPGFAQDDTTTFGEAGIGMLWPVPFFGWDWSLRTDVRYRYDVQQPPLPENTPRQFQDVVVNIGFQIPLSAPPPAPKPVKPEPVAVVPVEPPPEPPPPPPAGPIPEDAKPGDTIVLTGVNFALDSADLEANARTILDGVAQQLAARSALKVEVGGHTDNRGSDAYNQRLSERRAESVRAYLVEKGIAAGRLTAVGYGENQPLQREDTETAWEANRRVELKILE